MSAKGPAMLFADRTDAGRQLAEKLSAHAGQPDVIILALPRGGVPVAYEVARALHAPLDVFLVRKLGVPEHPELAMGAIASGDVRVLNEDVVDALHITTEVMDQVATAEARELERRAEAYRDGRPAPRIHGRTVVLVDDGLATGSTMRAAVAALRQLGPRAIIVAVPVAAADTCASLSHLVDDIVCLGTPRPFYAVGAWYDDFSQITDEQVRELLAHAAHEQTALHH